LLGFVQFIDKFALIQDHGSSAFTIDAIVRFHPFERLRIFATAMRASNLDARVVEYSEQEWFSFAFRGWFQRSFAKQLLPCVEYVLANGQRCSTQDRFILDYENDKNVYTVCARKVTSIPTEPEVSGVSRALRLVRFGSG
jgi:hypothetical protein